MVVGPTPKTLLTVGLAIAIAAAVLFGLQLRLQDPESSPVVPAEDPYTHMALVREHLRDGKLDPLNQPGSLYPPGMHALVAGVMVYTGYDLYNVVRFLPSFFGALGLVGIAVLMSRFESVGAALAAVLVFAVAPEAIFRTTMLSPTAVDLALLPFLAYALLETLQGKMAWAGPLVVLSAFMLFAHPWVFGILGVAGLVLILFTTLLPWSAKRGSLPTAWGLVAVVAIMGTGLAFSLTGCWGGCGPGFRDVLGDQQVQMINIIAQVVLALSLLPLLIKAVRPRAFRTLMPATRPPAPFALRLVLSQILLASVVALFFVAKGKGWPPEVDLMVMYGWPILVLGALGLAALPFRPSPAGHVGAGLALGTYPFVIFDPFHSPFWSHRTAVYLGIGLALLIGVGVAALCQAAISIAARMPAPTGATGAPGSRRARMAMLGVTGLVVLAATAGGAYAATPGQYTGGWYRLYSTCEFDGLHQVSKIAQSQPSLLVITPDWQSKLVLSGLTDDATRLWYKPEFYTDATERGNTIRMLEEQGRPILVVLDPKMAIEHPEIDPSFLQSSPWTSVGSWCSGNSTVQAYTVQG